jgi:hypothetical protein
MCCIRRLQLEYKEHPVKYFCEIDNYNTASTYLLILVKSATGSNMWHVPYNIVSHARQLTKKRTASMTCSMSLEVYPKTSPIAAPI